MNHSVVGIARQTYTLTVALVMIEAWQRLGAKLPVIHDDMQATNLWLHRIFMG